VDELVFTQQLVKIFPKRGLLFLIAGLLEAGKQAARSKRPSKVRLFILRERTVIVVTRISLNCLRLFTFAIGFEGFVLWRCDPSLC
jgi:hypothetical protein